jgi:hypothetical protein
MVRHLTDGNAELGAELVYLARTGRRLPLTFDLLRMTPDRGDAYEFAHRNARACPREKVIQRCMETSPGN